MKISPADITDRDDVYRLLCQFVTSYLPDPDAFARHFPQLVADNRSVFLVATDGENVVGYVLGVIALTLFANGPIIELLELMVDPAARGKGIGQALVESAARRAAELGCVEVTVPTRRASGFYQKLGFAETATFLKRRCRVENAES